LCCSAIFPSLPLTHNIYTKYRAESLSCHFALAKPINKLFTFTQSESTLRCPLNPQRIHLIWLAATLIQSIPQHVIFLVLLKMIKVCSFWLSSRLLQHRYVIHCFTKLSTCHAHLILLVNQVTTISFSLCSYTLSYFTDLFLNPRTIVHLQKLRVAYLAIKFQAFYGTRKFRTVCFYHPFNKNTLRLRPYPMYFKLRFYRCHFMFCIWSVTSVILSYFSVYFLYFLPEDRRLNVRNL
jgi:hypothetical protein